MIGKENMNTAVKLIEVSKTFPGGVIAVDDVSLELNGGIIYGVVGPNGAGKSTLMNLISGYLLPDKGEIYIYGNLIKDFHEAISAGVIKVEQNPNLAPGLTLKEHLALHLSSISVKTGGLERRCEELMGRLGVKVNLDARVEDLSISHLRTFEIAKALLLCELLEKAGRKPILILDEATVFFPVQQKQVLKDMLRSLLPRKYTILLISHDLAEVIDVSNQIIVMTAGRIASIFKSESLNMEELIKSMFDVTLVSESVKPPSKIIGNDYALKIEKLNVRDDRGNLIVKDLDLIVYSGEVHGIAVIPGTGEKELVECIYGLRRAESGRIFLFGEDITNLNIIQVKKKGVSFISDDRVRDGIIPDASVEDNLTIGSEEKYSYFKGIFISIEKKKTLAENLVKEFSIHAKSLRVPIITLSGGNMQRVYLARAMGSHAKLLIALHPTIGLDPMGTKIFFDKVNERRIKNLTTIIISPNVKELIAFCDRISVMIGGKIIGTFRPEEVTTEKLGLLVSGVVG
jgi:simple sugar transport system ATP-binding protein